MKIWREIKARQNVYPQARTFYCKIFTVQPNKILFLFGILIVNNIVRYETKKEEMTQPSTDFPIITRGRNLDRKNMLIEALKKILTCFPMLSESDSKKHSILFSIKI